MPNCCCYRKGTRRNDKAYIGLNLLHWFHYTPSGTSPGIWLLCGRILRCKRRSEDRPTFYYFFQVGKSRRTSSMLVVGSILSGI